MSFSVDDRARRRIDMWIFDLDGALEPSRLEASLSVDEIRRADRFVFEQDRRRFCIARNMLRCILAECTGIPPRDLVLRTDEHGRPHLDSTAAGLDFNLSHSAGVAAVAVSRCCKVGIDIEIVRPVDLDLARHYFSPSELGELLDLEPDERLPAFFRCWTRKEAVLKALGIGLSGDLQSFDVSVKQEPRPALRWRLHEDNGDDQWTLVAVEPTSTLICAVATPQTGVDVITHSILPCGAPAIPVAPGRH